MLASKAIAYPIRTPCGRLIAFLANGSLSRENLSRDKRFSLLCDSVSDEENDVCDIVTRCQCYETFFLHY
jgi:hypothetical protein